jgi:DNA-binding NarL/FixJ family response regulator
VPPEVEGQFASAADRHARALLSGEATALLDAGLSFQVQGALAEAADAVAQAARAAYRSGDVATFRKLAGRAESIADDVGGLDTPALRRVVPVRPLTRRQREVARLAATGLASREIANRLGVGVRTVESHLEAAYRRLGVSSRAELAEILGEREQSV